MKTQGISTLLFLIVAGICGAVGYVIGATKSIILQEQMVRRGVARKLEDPNGETHFEIGQVIDGKVTFDEPLEDREFCAVKQSRSRRA